MITTDDYDLYKKLQSLAWFGIESTYSEYREKHTSIKKYQQTLRHPIKTLMENLATRGITMLLT